MTFIHVIISVRFYLVNFVCILVCFVIFDDEL